MKINYIWNLDHFVYIFAFCRSNFFVVLGTIPTFCILIQPSINIKLEFLDCYVSHIYCYVIMMLFSYIISWAILNFIIIIGWEYF